MRHAEEVAAQRLQRAGGDRVSDRSGNAQVTLGPCADHRPVLQQEEQAERGERQEEGERREALDALRHAVQQSVERAAGGRARVLLGVARPCSNRRRGPSARRRACPWRPTAGCRCPRSGLRCRPRSPRRPPRRAPTRPSSSSAAPKPRGTLWRASHATTGDATAAITPAAITGMTIVCVSDRIQTAPTRNSEDADQQPRRHADVAQPAGRGEGVGQIGGIAPRRTGPRRSRSALGRTTRRAPWPSASRTRPA